jgi:hypothetical protein
VGQVEKVAEGERGKGGRGRRRRNGGSKKKIINLN